MISVIMGIYNEKNQNQVMQAIDSILEQTYCNLEFVICDDGSTPEFYQWLEEYCRKDERIHLIRKENNQGLAAALNSCLGVAKGSYIARMDADDISEVNRLEKQIEFMQQHPEYALVGCNADLIDDKGTWGERILVEKPQNKEFLRTSPFIHPSIVIKTDVLREMEGYSLEKYAERTEDYELFMRLYVAGYRGYNMQEKLFYYREDRNAYQKRKYRYRINESRVRYRGFRKLGILRGHIRYVIKPLLVGILPVGLVQRIRKRQYGA